MTDNRARSRGLSFSPELAIVGAVVVALVAANVGADRFDQFWRASFFDFGVGEFVARASWQSVVNDGLMTLFFFLAGAEIRHEVSVGALRSRAAAAMPILCAAGGMIVPATIYLLLNPRAPSSHGWAIPVATDVALTLAVLAMSARFLSPGVRAFLLALAIADDIGGIVVIAVVYSVHMRLVAIAAVVVALACFALIVRRAPGAYRHAAWVLPLAWAGLAVGHVEPAISGAAVGLLAPYGASMAAGPAASALVGKAVTRLQPIVQWMVLPVFALANAGIRFGGGRVHASIVMGVVLGLVVGKPLGIFLAATLARATGVGALPVGTEMREIFAGALLAGVGFTVSLYVVRLSRPVGLFEQSGRVGVLAASAAAAIIGTAFIRVAHRSPKPAEELAP